MLLTKTSACHPHEIPPFLTPTALKNGPLPGMTESFQATFLDFISHHTPTYIGHYTFELDAEGNPTPSPASGMLFIFISGLGFFLQHTPQRQIWTFRGNTTPFYNAELLKTLNDLSPEERTALLSQL